MTQEAQSPPPSLYEEAAKLVEEQMATDGVQISADTAWNFLTRYGVGVGTDGIPRLVESNYMREGAWQRRTILAREWLANNLAPGEVLDDKGVESRLDIVWKLAVERNGYKTLNQRPNISGLALENGLGFLIERICGVSPLIKKSLRTFRGFELARSAEVDELDMALFTPDDFRMFISGVWTTRKDRIAADLYEAIFLRNRRPDVAITFVVNEFHANLLEHLQNAVEVDRIYHVSMDLLLEVYRPRRSDGTPYDSPYESRTASTAFSTHLWLQDKILPLSRIFGDIDSIKPKAH